jgi:hypothetical protein
MNPVVSLFYGFTGITMEKVGGPENSGETAAA